MGLHIRHIALQNAAAVHRQTSVDLPRKGIVLATGANGAGKTSLLDAIPLALWGETLRGELPWNDGENAFAEVTTETHSVERSCSAKGKTSLLWHQIGEPATKYETLTKGQQALEAIVGSFQVWQATSVFSSSDSRNFSQAKGAERQRMLESLLGLDRFETALKLASKQRGETDKALEGKGHLCLRLKGDLQHLREQSASALESLAHLPAASTVSDGLQQELAQLAGYLKAAEAEAAEHRRQMDTLRRITAHSQAEARQCQEKAHQLNVPECPVCSQTIPDALRASLQKQASDALTRAAGGETQAQGQIEGITSALIEAEGEIRSLEQQCADLRARIRSAEGDARVRAGLEKQIASSQARENELIGALEKALLEESALARSVRVLKAAEGVLKAVRPLILARVLSGLERAANAWLPQLDGRGLHLEIRPFKENADGSQRDEITLRGSVDGGPLKAYQAFSTGQRRRFDVALLFALAEVAQAAYGTEPGTLLFDEVGDGLDVQGAVALCAALETLARDRCVVVVSHHEPIIRTLRPAVRWDFSLDGAGKTAIAVR